jgi:plasmid stabilization system protein ParE
MTVVGTDRARRHLRAVHDYSAADSPRNAIRMVDRITRKTESLGRFAMSGHRVPECEDDPGAGDIRQILEGNCRIIHRVRAKRIEVLAVIHGARQIPPTPELN